MGEIKENRFCKQLLYIALTVLMIIIMLPSKSLAANNESSYTVEFTYNGKQYVMNGDTTVELSGILDCIGIAGIPTSVSVSDESLFSATQINGKWTVTAHQAFHTDEWMKVTIDGAEYEIVVTDDTTYKVTFTVKKITIDGTEVDSKRKFTIDDTDYTFSSMGIVVQGDTFNDNDSTYRLSSGWNTFKGDWSFNLTFRPRTYSIIFRLEPSSGSENLSSKSSSNAIKNGSKTVEGFNVSSTSVNVDITTPFVDPTYTAPSSPSASSGSILTYNGSAQQLVGAGSVSKPEGGTMQYALGTRTQRTGDWSTTVPTGTNSGFYYVWWRIEESGIYNEVTGCCNSYINQASINPTVTMSGWTYGDTASEPSVSGNSGNGEVTYTYKRNTPYSGGFTSTKPSEAGTYTVKATISSSPNYTGGTATTNFTIAPKEVTLSWSNTSLTYNGKAQKPTATVGNLESGDTCTVTVTGERKDVGSYTATASGLSNSNYKLPTTNTRSCSINKAALTVTANSKTITYGDEPANAGVTYSGFKQGDSISTSLAGHLMYYYNYSQYGNVGSYTISPRGLTSDNYDITFTTGILTVSQKEVGLTWSDTSLTYNGSPQKPTAIATGTVNSDAIEVTVTGEQTDVGNDYMATATALTGAKAANYKLPSANTSSFTINKREVTVSGITADNKVYDKNAMVALNTSGASFAGILSGDVLTVSATGTFDNINVGTGKTVNISNLTLGGISAGNYKLADSGNQTITTANITARPVTVTAEAKSKIYGDADPSLTYISSGLLSGDIFTGALSRVSGENVGTYAIGQGTLTAGDNYTISYTGADFAIEKKTLFITADAKTKTYGNADPAFTYNAEGFAYNDTVENVMNGALTREEGEDVDTYVIEQGTLSAGDNYDISYTGANLTIVKRSVTLTSASDTKVYDGTALTNNEITISGDGFAESEGADYDVTGTQTLSGEANNTFTYTLKAGTKAGNYTITKQEGTLTVTDRTTDGADKKYEITVEANSGEIIYDGTEHTIDGFVNTEFIINGVTYTVSGLSASASGTDAGEYTAEVTGTAVVKDLAGNDLTNQFIVNTTDGTLTINKRNVTLTSATDSKVYDGNALTNSELTVTGDGFVTGGGTVAAEGADYSVTGSQKVVGSSANSFTYILKEGTKAGNYNITKVEGTLTVTSREAKYEISPQANSDTVLYDGEEHNASGLVTDTFEVDGNTYKVSGLTAEGSGTDAGVYTVNISGTAVVKDSDGADVSDEFSVTPQTGTLTVNKRSVTLTSDTASKAYDGKSLTSEKVTLDGDGFVEGESADYVFTGSQTLPGESDNTFTYKLINAKADNYDITTSYGKLTVNERSGEGDDSKYKITVKANSGTFTYDGKEHTVTGFETLEYSFNDVTYTVLGISASASLTDAGETTVEITGTPKVTDADGNDLTGNFDVVCGAGSLTVNKCPQEKPDSLSSRKASSDTAKDGVISGLDKNRLYEYSDDDGSTWTKVDEGSDEISGIGAGEILVRYQENDNSLPGDSVKVTVGTKNDQNAPSKEDMVITNASEENISDGEISGVDDTMEYSIDDGKNWTPVEEDQTVIDNLPVGDVEIRFKGDDDKNPSESIKISIGITSRTQGVVNFKSDESTTPVETSVESAQSSNIQEYAKTHVEEGKDVIIELVITPRNEEDVAESSVTEIAKASSEVLSSIEAENIETEYLEIDLAKYVDNTKEGNISDTGTPLEIELDYDSTKIGTPVVIRTHNGKAKVFERLSERADKAFKDAAYYVGSNKIYLYSQFFSDFAIVYATKKTYYVSIDTGIGDPIIQVVGENGDIELPTGLTNEGYVFDGWYKDAGYGKAWDSDNDKVNEDTNIYAKWNRSVTGVSVTADTVKFTKAGETSQIKVNVSPSDAANNNVTYKSSNTKVATVDAEGRITAVANGTAIITITTEDGAKTVTVDVTVAIPEIPTQGTVEQPKTTDQSATTGKPDITDQPATTGKPDTTDKSAATEKPVTTETKRTEQTSSIQDQSTQTDIITYKVTKSEREKSEISLNEGLKVDQTGSKIKVTWGKVSGAYGYDVYVTYCGKKFSKKPAKTLKKASATTTTITKINGKRLNLKKNFKLYVAAYKKVNGTKVTLGKSITGHIAGRKNKRYTNVREIKITNHTIINVYIGIPHRIQAKTILVDKSKQQLSDAHAAEFRYASSNKKIATVDKNGVIKGVKAGKCTIFVYARNGYAKKISVTVK